MGRIANLKSEISNLKFEISNCIPVRSGGYFTQRRKVAKMQSNFSFFPSCLCAFVVRFARFLATKAQSREERQEERKLESLRLCALAPLREKCLPPRLRRAAFTLIELLVVLAVLMILASAAIPKLRPAMDNARTREAARAVHLYLSSARNLAMSTGRPCGVMIERAPSIQDSDGCRYCSMTLTQVETPAPYGGDSLNSTVAVTSTGGGNVQMSFTPAIDTSIVHPNDQIQFNYQGPWYTILDKAVTQAAVDPAQVQALNPWINNPLTNSPPAVPYKILRQPVKSTASALQLPAPAVIDLACSGGETGQGGAPCVWPCWVDKNTAGGAKDPITIVFAPDGSVGQLYCNNCAPGNGGNLIATRPSQPIYLLVGKIEEIPMPSDTSQSPGDFLNLSDQTNLWVAVNAATGLIVTTEIYPAANGDIWTSRTYARQSDAMVGK
jgi:prepilin-type N-terminal cleavage/methylation domain-containing protein